MSEQILQTHILAPSQAPNIILRCLSGLVVTLMIAVALLYLEVAISPQVDLNAAIDILDAIN
jgi:capsular polysaccharide biosynthesis protein